MSAPKKPQGGSDSELTRLKNLSPEQREAIWGWRSEVDSDQKPFSNAALRNRLAERFGIRLSQDAQLSKFWSWQFHQTRVESYNGMLEQFQDFYSRLNPNASRQKVREAGIAFFMTEAAANGDRDAFLDVAHLDLAEVTAKTKAAHKERELKLAEEKFQLEFCEKILDQATREQAERIANSNLSQADKIAEMRRVAFKEVDELQKSGKVQIPKL